MGCGRLLERGVAHSREARGCSSAFEGVFLLLGTLAQQVVNQDDLAGAAHLLPTQLKMVFGIAVVCFHIALLLLFSLFV